MRKQDQKVTVHGAEFIRQNKDSFIVSWGGVIDAYPKNTCQINQDTKELTAPLVFMQKRFPETDFTDKNI